MIHVNNAEPRLHYWSCLATDSYVHEPTIAVSYTHLLLPGKGSKEPALW